MSHEGHSDHLNAALGEKYRVERDRFSFGAREVAMDWPSLVASEGRTYDVSRDGKRFIAVKVGDETETGPRAVDVTVVVNWFAQLPERMGGS